MTQVKKHNNFRLSAEVKLNAEKKQISQRKSKQETRLLEIEVLLKKAAQKKAEE